VDMGTAIVTSCSSPKSGPGTWNSAVLVYLQFAQRSLILMYARALRG